MNESRRTGIPMTGEVRSLSARRPTRRPASRAQTMTGWPPTPIVACQAAIQSYDIKGDADGCASKSASQSRRSA